MKYSAILKFVKGLTHKGRIAQCLEKIESLFQVDNRLINRINGEVFTVCEVGTGQAVLRDEKGNLVIPSWFSNSGRLKHEVAEVWDHAPS